MLLCLDVGNSHIFGGVFKNENIQLRFRHNTSSHLTSDQIGIFLKNVLRENSLKPKNIKNIAIGSVVPSIDYSIRAACKKYFNVEPLFLIGSEQKILCIKIDRPNELGADLIAGAIASTQHYPGKNLIIIDFGTATTFAVINKECDYLGTVITPGMRLSIEALENNTAKLPPAEILEPKTIVGKNSKESIQAGLYYGHLGMIKEIIAQIKNEQGWKDSTILATGGFSYLFEKQKLFNAILPDLVLDGLRYFVSHES